MHKTVKEIEQIRCTIITTTLWKKYWLWNSHVIVGHKIILLLQCNRIFFQALCKKKPFLLFSPLFIKQKKIFDFANWKNVSQTIL